MEVVIQPAKLALLCLLAAGMPGSVEAQTQTPAQQVAAAVLPLPPALRSGATVVRVGARGPIDTLRQGTNPMVCFSDFPSDTLFDVRCYHSGFVPLLYRARALRAAGATDSSIDAQIDREVRAGTLTLPATPTAGYRMFGPITGLNSATVSVTAAVDRWQSVHMPYAAAEGWGCRRRSTTPSLI